MKTQKILTSILTLALALILGHCGLSVAGPMSTAFTYQGRLIDANAVADGLYDLQFKLFDDPNIVTGNQIGEDVNVPDMDVIDGYFTVQLDFGQEVFDGNAVWLEIGVRPGDMNDPNLYTVLTPRQEVLPTPYALFAMNGGSGTDSDWIISGNEMYSGVSGNVGIGTTSPSAKLDVDGDININSVYKIGNDTVLSNSPGTTDNIFVGVDAGYNNTTGNWNTFSGASAGRNNTTVHYNTFSGYQAGYHNTTGNCNTFSGIEAGYKNTTGHDNTFLGIEAGYENTTGCDNTFLGVCAGHNNTTGSGNVFIGYKAGYNETGSYKLYIANSAASSVPLIYGDFLTGNVGIGMTSPDTRLHVEAHSYNNEVTTFATSDFDAASHTGSRTLFFMGAASGDTYSSIQAQDQGGISNNNLVLQQYGGNVGIGTTSPSEKLQVNGNVKANNLAGCDYSDVSDYSNVPSSCTNLTGVSLTLAAPGYVIVTFSGYIHVQTSSLDGHVFVGIARVTNAFDIYQHCLGENNDRYPFSVQNVYPISWPATYNFYGNARSVIGESDILQMKITAIYVPNRY